jgi:hypothetical protein
MSRSAGDLLAPHERRRGLPIGNLISQLWANLYLDTFDHWVKETLKAEGYLRFVDDFILLHNSKDSLRVWRDAVQAKLEGLRLALNSRKCVVRRCDEGVPFLGYVVWLDRIRVRGETVRRFRRRLRRKERAMAERGAGREQGDQRSSRSSDNDEAWRQSLAAWRGHVSLAGTYRRLGAMS